MDSVEQTIVLGFDSAQSIPMAYAKEGDTNRTIHFEFINDLSTYSVQDTTYIFLREQFSDKTIMAPERLDKSGLSPDGTEFDMPLNKYMTAIPGTAKCELVFVNSETVPEFDMNGEIISDDCVILSTQIFNLFIGPITYDERRSQTADTVRVSELIQLVLAAESAADLDKIVEQNEEVRIGQELERVTAEEFRNEAETARNAAEEDRVNSELVRASAEELRDQAEQARDSAESLRVQNEQERADAEQLRNTSETERNNAEDVRSQNESERTTSETARVQAEELRESAEAVRASSEEARVNAETARAASESTRESNESTRNTNEQTRIQNESTRETGETERLRAEQERIAREGAGTFESHSSISYEDSEGNIHTIEYKDSRVGIAEKINAIAEGGSYIDSSGNSYTLANEYENLDGDVVPVDPSMLNNMSVIAIGVMAKEIASEAKEDLATTQQIITEAAQSATAAAQSATDAAESARAAQAAIDSIDADITRAETAAINATQSEQNAKASEEAAAASEQNAKTSELSAKTSEENASASEVNAESYKTVAETSAQTATNAATAAEASAQSIIGAEESARQSAESAEQSAASALADANRAEQIAQGLAGALLPMGTITFEELPSDADAGYMYNISNSFVTTSAFKEGAGHEVSAGANVYRTSDGYWDVLAGTTVTGVKGSEELSYRTGNIEITKANIGLSNVDNTADADKSVSHAETAGNAAQLDGHDPSYFATQEDLEEVAQSSKHADEADSLTTAGTANVNLASSASVTYTNGGNITLGVTGVLPVANGGTGANDLGNITVGNATKANALATAGTANVDLTSSSSATYTNGGNVTLGVTGVLPIANGGTGSNSLDNITVGNATKASVSDTQPTTDNSTKLATTAFVKNYVDENVQPGITMQDVADYINAMFLYGTDTMEAGDVLESGKFYFQYEE